MPSPLPVTAMERVLSLGLGAPRNMLKAAMPALAVDEKGMPHTLGNRGDFRYYGVIEGLAIGFGIGLSNLEEMSKKWECALLCVAVRSLEQCYDWTSVRKEERSGS